jgi:hypothetical protein
LLFGRCEPIGTAIELYKRGIGSPFPEGRITMILRVLITVVLLMLASDSPLRRTVIDYAALFEGGTSIALEKAEVPEAGANLMNCGDYSGCTLVRIVTARERGETGRLAAALRPARILPAILYQGKTVSASDSRP